MKQTAVVKLTRTVNDRVYSFEMQMGAPYGESYDILWEMLQEIVKLSKEAAEKAKREEDKKEEVIVEIEKAKDN